MAKTVKTKSLGAREKTQAKQSGGFKAALVRSSSRAELKHSSASPRGAVSAKPAGRIRTFFREVRIEMKKVTWPPRKELIKSTGVVIVAVAIAGVFIGLFDYIWQLIVEAVGLAG